MPERMGLLGKKLGMTQVYAEDGECIPVTVVQAGPCVVTGVRTADKDGYSALVLGFDEKPVRLTNRPENGAFVKHKLTPMRLLKEIRLSAERVAEFTIGQRLLASDVFEAGKPVDVQGTTKGKGTQGVLKRWGMRGGKASHGVHEYYRHGGSIGCRLTPGHVFKGKKMGGRMGDETKTVQGLELVAIDEARGVVLIRGSVPGPKNGYVLVQVSAKHDAYRKRGTGEQERSKNPLKASKKAAAGR